MTNQKLGEMRKINVTLTVTDDCQCCPYGNKGWNFCYVYGKSCNTKVIRKRNELKFTCKPLKECIESTIKE